MNESVMFKREGRTALDLDTTECGNQVIILVSNFCFNLFFEHRLFLLFLFILIVSIFLVRFPGVMLVSDCVAELKMGIILTPPHPSRQAHPGPHLRPWHRADL